MTPSHSDPRPRLQCRVPRYPRALGVGALLIASACSRAGELPATDAAAPLDGSGAQASGPSDGAPLADASLDAPASADGDPQDSAMEAAADGAEAGKTKAAGPSPTPRPHPRTGGVPPPSYDSHRF